MRTNLKIQFTTAPYVLSGVVYTSRLNHREQLAALGDAVNHPPYKTAPVGPVLAIRPRNTLANDGDPVSVPAGVDSLSIGATLGIVIGRTASRVSLETARTVVAGYIIVNEICVPHPSHYRPAVRFMARDGFCPLGPTVVPAADIPDPDALMVRVLLDGVVAQETTTGERIRNVDQLIADVTEFMTLEPGDLLLLGTTVGAPLARVGQQVEVQIEGLGCLSNRLIQEVEAI